MLNGMRKMKYTTRYKASRGENGGKKEADHSTSTLFEGQSGHLVYTDDDETETVPQARQCTWTYW